MNLKGQDYPTTEIWKLLSADLQRFRKFVVKNLICMD